MRPDYERLARQQQTINFNVGHTATLRAFIGSEARTPTIGIGDEPQYQTTIITALFAPAKQSEVSVPGGVFREGDIIATLDRRPDGQDEIIWRGTVYRIASDPLPLPLMGNKAWHVHLRRGGATG